MLALRFPHSIPEFCWISPRTILRIEWTVSGPHHLDVQAFSVEPDVAEQPTEAVARVDPVLLEFQHDSSGATQHGLEINCRVFVAWLVSLRSIDVEQAHRCDFPFPLHLDRIAIHDVDQRYWMPAIGNWANTPDVVMSPPEDPPGH